MFERVCTLCDDADLLIVYRSVSPHHSCWLSGLAERCFLPLPHIWVMEEQLQPLRVEAGWVAPGPGPGPGPGPSPPGLDGQTR